MKIYGLSVALGLVLAVGAVAVPPAQGSTRRATATVAAAPNHAKHKYTAKQAEKIALKKHHGKLVHKTKLGNQKGKWDYAVCIQSGKTMLVVFVGADTGKIDKVVKGMAMPKPAPHAIMQGPTAHKK